MAVETGFLASTLTAFGISTESGGNVVVDFSHVRSFKIEFGLILQTLKNRFKVSINDEGNLELVLPTMESHEGILFGHVYSHCFIVYVILEVLAFCFFTLEYEESVQAKVVFMLVLTGTAHK